MKANAKLTVADALFEEFCDQAGVTLMRVPEAEEREPDYELALSEGTVYAEVKQIDPNDDDQRAIREFEANGITSYCRLPGQRVRNKIDSAKGQLARRCQGKHPGLLVLYDNVPLGHRTGNVDPYQIMTALYGLEKVRLAESQEGWEVAGVNFGKGTKARADYENADAISAVAVLVATPADIVRLHAYHNFQATVPLDPSWLRHREVHHHCLARDSAGNGHTWIEQP